MKRSSLPKSTFRFLGQSLSRVSGRKRRLADPPGSLVHFGARRSETFHLQSLTWDEEGLHEISADDLLEGRAYESRNVIWHRMHGLHDVENLARIGERFEISSLVLEDILNTSCRPKIEKREDTVFVLVKLITVKPESSEVDVQQFSLLLLPDETLLSFLEGPSEALDPILERIRSGRGGRIRRHGADYLLWALLDAVVDHYLFVIDQFDETISIMEERLQADPDDVEAAELYSLKRDVGQLFRAIRPIREISGSLRRPTTPLLDRSSEPYFADLNDHAVQVIETTEDLRESVSALRDFFLSTMSNRMNEIMKVLTCFSTIFLPLTFVAGIYGMNFEKMPELGIPWAYPAVWVLFVLCAAGMFVLFRRKDWL